MIVSNNALTAGFAFVEFSGQDHQIFDSLFDHMGFSKIGSHVSCPVDLYSQNEIYFILNRQPESFANQFSAVHGPAACAAGFYVRDPQSVYRAALSHGAESFKPDDGLFTNTPLAIRAIGGSVIYLIDADQRGQLFKRDFTILDQSPPNIGLQTIDHLAYNVERGDLDKWAEFFKSVFSFREIRYFQIKGKKTALRSRALLSACGTMRLTINESADDKSQIAEFIQTYNGAGIQHIALNPTDIYQTVESMKSKGVPFIPVPDSYYHMVDERLPGHNEDLARMQKNYILLDGVSENREILLQIVTPPVIGPMFFEVIQRKGCDGFGEGNFTALFEALERDQVARGVLAA